MITGVINNYIRSGADPNFGQVVLLLGFEGTDGSTTITDESPTLKGNATIDGNAQIDTSQSKFGASSLLLDGNNDVIKYGDFSDFEIGTDDFTIEMWVRFAGLTGNQTFISKWVDSSTRSYAFLKTSTGDMHFSYSTNGSTVIDVSGSWGPVANQWYHIAVDRESGTLRTYADGVMIGKDTVPALANFTTALRIGTTGGVAFGELNDFNGWIDEVRFTQGLARYASDGGYTVPTSAFPRS